MPGTIIQGPGTVQLTGSPGVLNSIYVNNATFGSISVFAGGTASLPGTPVYRWVPTAMGEQRELNLASGAGLSIVLNAATLVYVVTGRK